MKILCLLFWALSLFSPLNENIRNSENRNSFINKSEPGSMYYEYHITVLSSQLKNGNQGISTMKIYVSADGHARIEWDIPMQSGTENKISHMVIIGYSGKPHESTIVNEQNKTYTVLNFDSLKMPASLKIESTVTKAGEERILGYNCVHVKIISLKHFGTTMTITDTLDVWKSPDVPVPAAFGDWLKTYENKSSGFMSAPDVPAKLAQFGCKGFTVKNLVRSKSVSVSMELVKTEHRNFSGSMFEIPAGFTENKENRGPF